MMHFAGSLEGTLVAAEARGQDIYSLLNSKKADHVVKECTAAIHQKTRAAVSIDG